MARLQVERLGIDMVVLEGESGEVLAFGPGHLPGSSAPGQDGHCILAGHRDTSFKFLQDLVEDDLLILQTVDGVTQSYKIRGSVVHKAEDLYFQQSTLSCLTLLTCYPFDSLQPNTLFRYIVFAEKES